MKTKPSALLVLNVLRLAGERGATALDVWRLASVYRTSARVMELRQLGYRITTTLETTEDGQRVARYRLTA